MIRVVVYVADSDAEKLAKLRRSDELGNSIFMDEFAGEGVTVYFDPDEVPEGV